MNIAMWECTYSDQLWFYIQQIQSDKQRRYFERIFKRFGEYTQEHDELLTLREYMDMREREKKDKFIEED